MARGVAAAVVLLAASCTCSKGPPVITDPFLLALTAAESSRLVVHGTGFGNGGTLLLDGVAATGPVQWSDTKITADSVPLATVKSVSVVAGGVTSNAVSVRHFALDTFPIAPTAMTNASPLALAASDAGVWVNEEFHRQFHLATAAGVSVLPPQPVPPDPGPFAVYFEHFCLGATCSDDVDQRTQTSVLGEDVIVDSRGRVWFSEGGGLLYEQGPSRVHPENVVRVHPNHSRIVMFDPASSSWRVYSVPGDRNEVIGLAWDGAAIWFCEGGFTGGSRIGRLEPEVARFDTASPAFDFSSAAPAAGYTFFPVPLAKSYPSMPLTDPDGHVWFTMYLGNAIGRLDPVTGEVEIFPLPRERVTRGPGKLFATGGPWRLAFWPDGDHVAFGEQYDFEVTTLDAARVRQKDGACRTLAGDGTNACMKSVAVDDPAVFPDGYGNLLHSIFVVGGELWFDEMGSSDPAATDDRIGIVSSDLKQVVTLPPRSFGGPNGLAADGAGNVWFAGFHSHALGRLLPQP